jgi:hypothetical protein
MTSLAEQKRLEADARAQATALGHDLGLFYFVRDAFGAAETASCTRCGAVAAYAPNNLGSLSGLALTTPCRAPGVPERHDPI